MRSRRVVFLLLLSLFLTLFSFVGCRKESLDITLDKNPQYKANVSLAMDCNDPKFSQIYDVENPDNQSTLMNRKNYLKIEDGTLRLYNGDSLIYTFDIVAGLSTAMLYGKEDGLDDMYLLADGYLFKCDKGEWNCLISLQQSLIRICYGLSYDDGLMMIGEYGVGDSISGGLLKLDLVERSEDIVDISIALIDYSPYESWIMDSVLLFNSRNDDINVTVESYEYMTDQLLIDMLSNRASDVFICSEFDESILINSEYITKIDYSKLDDSKLVESVINSLDGDYLVPFYKLKCIECYTQDPVVGKEYIDLFDLNNNNGHIIRHDDKYALFNLVYSMINYDDLSLTDIDTVLRFCDECSELSYTEDNSIKYQLEQGELRFLNSDIDSIFEYISLDEYFDGEMTLVDLGGEGDIRFCSDMFINIIDNCDCEEEIYSFLNAILSEEYQRLDVGILTTSIPLNKCVFDDVCSEALSNYLCNGFANKSYGNPSGNIEEMMILFDKYIDVDYRIRTDTEEEDYGREVELMIDAMESGNMADAHARLDNSKIALDHHLLDDPQKSLDSYISLVEAASGFYINDYRVYTVFCEEIGKYFDGEYSREDIAKIIYDRIKTYKEEVAN